MERNKVKRILMFCRDIDGEIKHNKRIIQDYEDRYYSMSSGSPSESFMNSRNRVSKPTETVALNVPEYVNGEIRELQEQNEQLGKLKSAILHELNKLSLPQKTILYDFYIKRLQWVQISARIHYSGTQCKKIRNRALDHLAHQFTANEFIANFNYPN